MKTNLFLIAMAALTAVLLVVALSGDAAAAFVSTLLMALSGVAVGAILRGDNDTTLRRTLALPNGAATTVSSGLDLANSAKGDMVATAEILVEAPALNTTQLPDTKTMIYDLYHDSASDFSTEVLLEDNVITQTGAGGAGDGAEDAVVGLPSNVKRYVRLKATGSAAGDATGATATVSVRAG